MRRGLALALGAVLTLANGWSAEPVPARDLRQITANKVFRDRVQPHWLAGNDRFWYEVKTGPETREYILVDAVQGTRRPAFDAARLAAGLTATGVVTRAESLRLDDLEFTGTNVIQFRAGGKTWQCSLADYGVSQQPPAPVESLPALPADAPRASRRTGPETSLTFVNRTADTVELFWLDTDGARQSYGRLKAGEEREQHTFAGHVWLVVDRDGKTLGTFEATENGGTVEVPVTRTSRPIQANGAGDRPRRRNRGGPPRGLSPDGHWRVVVRDFNVVLQDARGTNEFPLTNDGKTDDGYADRIYWSPNSQKVVVTRTQPAQEHKVYLIESSPADQVQPKLQSLDYLKPGDRVAVDRPELFDLATRQRVPVSTNLFPNPWSVGDVRWAPDSSRFTFLYNQRGHQVLRILAVDAQTGACRPIVDEQSRTFIDYSGKFFAEYLDDTDEIIWMSERDGWNHLYLCDAKTGQVKNQITRGDWVVRGVDLVDAKARQIWFRAGGIRPGQDPYQVHYCRVNFDGSGLTVLTEGDGTHTVAFSPDRRFFLDTWSRVDQPPVTELRRATDGRRICDLEHADWAALLQAGWRAPEHFVAQGRDGQTEIYGIIIRPMRFDPQRRYPVIENIYAGPQDSYVPKAFRVLTPMQELAELGCVVVQIDGMGTSNRSKKFHDVCWKNLADAGLPDRILWLKAAAAERPWMDLSRFGIYGTSAGGQSALGALLTHGDFYKAAVADCGCHDNRMDKIWWNEQWMGWPVGPEYAAQSNVTMATRLQGKLLLMVGEMDRNVDPASTMQVVNALIKANKDFELLVMPGAGHGVAGTPYGRHRLEDFFQRNLLATAPPAAAGH